ncbi:hypothetical protein, partial [Staphylococcus epidermidis]|jgi:hypothetical protein|uniref:hypothetical protein n=1 Tax=Staphylococcus epidermidis TaxID=1282 RepID=UPI002738D230
MKTSLLFSLLTLGSAYAQEPANPTTTTELTCSLCADFGIPNDVCEAHLQKQIDALCAADGGAGQIQDVHLIQRFAGGFCFDGHHGGRLIGARNSVTYTCVAR